jgi:predicted phosphodiesterase
MRYLLISDVHGNLFGLEAVFSHAKGLYDRVFCLGDVVGYGAHPNECCSVLREAGAHSLLGNHDAAALGQIDITWFNPVATSAILWTREQLTAENRAWLESLVPTFSSEEDDFQAVHASLRQPIEEYIVDGRIAQASFHKMERSVCFYGHTHVADCYRSRDVAGKRYAMEHTLMTRGGVILLEDEWRYLLNPGSCGQPRDGNPQARYACSIRKRATSKSMHSITTATPRARQSSRPVYRMCWATVCCREVKLRCCVIAASVEREPE